MNGEIVSTEQKVFRLFQAWLALVALIFLFVAVTIIVVHERLYAENLQERLLSYVITFILGYGYLRMLLHVITGNLLHRGSKTCQTMPVVIQQDCAYMVVDFLSGFIWIPIIVYGVYKLFSVSTNDEFFDEMLPVVSLLLGAYQLDRLMQVMNHFRMDRFFHHVFECAWTLLVLEWWPSGRERALWVAALIEGASKPVWYQFASGRWTRRYYRNHQRGTEEDGVIGLDNLFIASTPEKTIARSRFFFAFWIGIHHSMSFVMVLIYLGVKADSLLLWRILVPIAVLIFLLMDLPSTRLLYRMTCMDYWTRAMLAENPATESNSQKVGVSPV